MRTWAVLLFLLAAVAAHAYILGTESLDLVYQGTQTSVNVIAVNGQIWSTSAYYPLIATNAYGGCLAIADRPYIYYIHLNETLGSITVNLVKYSIVSLFTPYGYMVWSQGLSNTNITSIATNCVDVAVGTEGGRVIVVGETGVINTYNFGSPITALAYSRDGSVLYVGTYSGQLYAISAGGVTQIASGPGSVLFIGVNPHSTQPYAVWFYKRGQPHVFIWPLNIDLTPGAISEYGTNTPAVPAAVSQDGSTLAVGIYDQLYVYRDGQLWYTAGLPSAPTAVAVSGNGSIIAVGTLGGQVMVFWNGRVAAEWDAGAPVTSVATSWDGLTIAVETWTGVEFERLAIGVVEVHDPPTVIEVVGPQPCLNETIDVVAGGTTFTYTVNGAAQVLLPVGQVSIVPQYKYLSQNARCAPMNNVTLDVTGNLQQPIILYYQLQYKVSLSPPGLVSGPAWTFGPTTYAAQPSLNVQLFGGPSAGMTASMSLAYWDVNGTIIGLPTPSITVNVTGPMSISAVYQMSAPQTIPINSTARWQLKYLVVYNRYGQPITSGLSPYVSDYPVTAQAYYVMQFLVSTSPPATVNGTAELWADEGSSVVFSAPAIVDFGNGTRIVFQGWSNGQAGNFTATVAGPMYVAPIYVKQYFVSVKSPGTINGQSSGWFDAGSTATLNIPQVLSTSGQTRTAFAGWVINGRAGPGSATASITVDAPMNITYNTKTQYLVIFATKYGTPTLSQTWADAGSTLYVTVMPEQVWEPPPLLYQFAGWRAPDGNVYQPPIPVVAPGVYEAVWSLNIIPLAAIAGGAGGGVAAYIFIRRRRAAFEVET
jgi:hypothetical protein